MRRFWLLIGAIFLLAVALASMEVGLAQTAKKEPLPAGAVLRLLSSEQPIWALAFSPDSSVLASACPGEDAIRLWNSANGEQLRKIDVGNPTRRWNDLAALHFSPDGKSLVTFSTSGTVFLWDLTSRQSHQLTLDGTSALAFTPDGKNIAVAYRDAAGGACMISVRDVATGKESRKFTPLDQNIREYQATALAFSPDGKWLAIGSVGNEMTLWDMEAGKKLLRWVGESKAPTKLAFLQGVRHLATTSWNGTVHIYDTTTGKEIRKIATPDEDRKANSPWPSYAFSANGKRVALSLVKGNIVVIDIPSGKEVRRFQGHPRGTSALAFASDGDMLASAGIDGEILVWQVDPETAVDARLARLKQPGGQVLNEYALVGSRTPLLLHKEENVMALAGPADGKRLFTIWGSSGTVSVWNTANVNEPSTWRLGCGKINQLAVSPSGTYLAAACQDGQVRIWHYKSQTHYQDLIGFTAQSSSVAFSADEKFVALGGFDGRIGVWDVTQKRTLFTLKANAKKVLSVAFSPDSKTLAVGGVNLESINFGLEFTARGVTAWQPAAVELFPVQAEPRGQLLRLRGSRVNYSPNGRTLVTSGQYTLVDDGSKNRGSMGSVVSVRGSESCFVVSQLMWWDVGSETLIRQQQSKGTALAFSNDSKWLLTGDGTAYPGDSHKSGNADSDNFADGDGSLRLLECATGKELFVGRNNPAAAVALVNDGKSLAWLDYKGIVRLWDISPKNVLARYPKGLSTADLESNWSLLKGDYDAAAFQAHWHLAADPTATVPFLQKHLKPAVAIDDNKLAQLIADLDDPQAAVREAAMRDLTKLHALAEPALRKALVILPSQEMKQRGEILLDSIRSTLPPVELQKIRAVHVLGRIATPEARRVLETLAKGVATAPQTVEARLALERWK